MNTSLGDDLLRADAAQHAEWLLCSRRWKTEAGAIRALQRKHPEVSEEECRAVFAAGLQLYHAVVAFIDESEETLWDRWNAVADTNSKGAASIDVRDLAEQLARRVPGFPPTTYERLIGGLFVWWHVK